MEKDGGNEEIVEDTVGKSRSLVEETDGSKDRVLETDGGNEVIAEDTVGKSRSLVVETDGRN